MINVLDLFAGAGGLSEGFHNEDFNIISHVEMDANACFTLKTREAFRYLLKNKNETLYYNYLKGNHTRESFYSMVPELLMEKVINAEISSKSINGIFKRIDNLVSSSKNKNIDIIIGGPPCQAYSIVGRARDSNKMVDDPRNFLYRYYGRFLKKYQPKIFLFENVPGIISASNGLRLKTIFQHFSNSGYRVFHPEGFILNSTNFGVVQNRNRVIIVGIRKDLDIEPYFNFKSTDILKSEDLICHDLPKIKSNDGNIHESQYIKSANSYLKKSGIRTNEPFTTQHYSRFNNENDLEIYRIVAQSLVESNKKINYHELPKHLIKHTNTNSFKNRFKAIHPKEPSQTIVAHLERDGHYFIHPDIEQNRSITIREAARLQSFPDNYFFEGPRGAAFKQIGNAVPPLMARGLAKMIKDILQE